MAEETVDALVITTRFDDSGLDAASQAQLAALRRFHSTAETLSRNSLTKQAAEIQKFSQEANDVLQLRGFTTDVSVRELQELEAAFPPLVAALERFDPTGILRNTARQAQEATAALRGAAEAAAGKAAADETARLAAEQAKAKAAADQLANAEENLAASMARQSQAAAQAGAAARLQAEEALRAQRIALQAQRLAVAAAGGAGPPPPPPPVGPWLTLARGYEGAAVAAERARIEAEALRAVMLQTGQAADRGAQGAIAWARGLENIERSQGKVVAGSILAGRGFNKIENALTGLLLTSTGVPPAIAGISNALIGLGVNSVPVLGVLAAVAVLAAAYQALTKETREAQEATAKFAKEQAEILRQARTNPYAELARSISGVRGETEGLVNQIARLQNAIERIQTARAVILPIFGPNAAVFAKGFAEEAQRQLETAQQALQAQQLAFVETTRARVEAILTARIAAEQEAAQAELRIQQAGLQQRDQQLRTAFEREEVTREQFFARRIDLAREGAAAEIALLRQQREQEIERAVPAGQERAQAARIRSLEAAIRLREIERDITIDQIAAEEERGRVAAQLLPIQRQLADLQARRAATTEAGIGSVEFDTSQAEAQLDTLDTQIRQLAAFAEQRPDVGFDTSTARAGLEDLRVALERLIQEGAGAEGRLEFDTALAEAQLDALEAKARQTFLEARTEAERELALDAIVRLRAERTTQFQQEVQRQLNALEFTVDLTADTEGVERALRDRLGIPIPIELDTQAAVNRAEALRAEIARRITEAGGELQASPIDVAAFRELTQRLQAVADAPIDALNESARRASEALAAGIAAAQANAAVAAGAGDAEASAADTAAIVARTAPLVAQVRTEYERVTAAINSGVLSGNQLIETQREQIRLAEELRRAQEASRAVVPAEAAPTANVLDQATKDYLKAKEQFDTAKDARQSDAAADAAADMHRFAEQMRHSIRAVNEIAQGLGLSADEAAALYAIIARANEALDDGGEAAQRLQRALGNALDVLGAIQRFGASTGIFSEQDQRFLDALGGIGATVGNFASGNIFGGIISAIDTLGGLFGGGPSPAEIAMRQNTEAINRNTIARTQGFEGLGGAADAAAILNQVLGTVRGQFLAGNTEAPGAIGRGFRAELVADLEALGLSFEQLQRIAEEAGIPILANGRLVGGALEQLAEELVAAAEAAFAFHEGLFEDEQRLRALRSRAQGIDQDPMEIFRQNLEAAAAADAGGLFAPIQEAFQTGDADSIRQAILAMLDAWENNLIDIEGLGGLTREQWEEILRSGLDAADAIEQLGESARVAGLEMSNVPRGFRQAAHAFEAMEPETTMRRVDIPLVNVRSLGGDGDQLPQLVAAVERLNAGTQIFNIEVSGANKTAEQILDEVVEAAERRGAAGGVTVHLRAGRP